MVTFKILRKADKVIVSAVRHGLVLYGHERYIAAIEDASRRKQGTMVPEKS